MNVPTDRAPQNCVLASLNQMGRNSETAPSFLRGPTTSPVATRLSSLPKLPLQDYARARSVSLQPDSAGYAVWRIRNWKYIRHINALSHSTSIGGETHPYGVGENRAKRVLPLPPQGFRARDQRPPSSPIQRRRSRTARHQTAVVFHQSSQPEKETTHG
jgi:hypothetical protein